MGGNSDFMKAHTCFNRIEIPFKYESKEDLAEGLRIVLNQEQFFFDFE